MSAFTSLFLCCLAGLYLTTAALAEEAPPTLTLEFPQAQTAVLDPVNWDKVIPNERYFDAVRPLLVRFPGSAEGIYAKLQAGYGLDKVELVLTWIKQEGPRPERGRSGWGAEELYTAMPGEWHVIAYPLRRPWSVEDPALGPTFNAAINGLEFWARGGARGDGADRLATRFGPLPLHGKSPQARLDITGVFADAAYGATLGRRLRAAEEQGFQVHKQELRDMKYRYFSAYDWSVSIGYMKIWVEAPKLVVTLRHGAGKPAHLGALPPATSVPALAVQLKAAGAQGTPSMAYPADLAARAAKCLTKPAGVPDWQWRRIEELRAIHAEPTDSQLYLGRGYNFSTLYAGDQAAYLKAMQNILLMPPRTWQGHPSSDFAILPAAYPDLLPPAVLDHLKLYWEAWLSPEVQSGLDKDLGGGTQRGGPTYFRGYTRNMGTMNFNHNAVTGTLLGGQLLKAPHVLANASYGLENLLLRAQAFGNGAHQEIGDTYYQAITVVSAGALAKYAEAPVDQVMGRILRDRLVEPLISMYHPGLHRMTHPMARGDFAYQMLLQEGPYSVLHTLSPKGVLLHLNDLSPKRTGTPSGWGKVHGFSILGDEAPPERIAVLSPWTEPYLADSLALLVDEKPLPWQVIAADSSPGTRPGGWHVNYLGRHYALASRDNTNYDYGTVPITAQWRRAEAPVAHMDDLTTLQMNWWVNGQYTPAYNPTGEFGAVQCGPKLLAMKALPERRILESAKAPVKAMHTSVAIIATGDTAGREVWINEGKIAALSGARPDPGGDWKKRMASTAAAIPAQEGDLITIHDGVTYIGLIPLTANALARDRQVELSFEYPTLLIHNFVYRSEQPLELDRLYALPNAPTAGFVLEMGDVTQYPTFADFRAHMRAVKLASRWNAETRRVEMTYASGGDTLEMGFDPLHYPTPFRRVNGRWPYLPAGILRETPWSVQGTIGRLEKGGASLLNEPGHTGYLQAIPATETYIGYNPFPDPTCWALSVPGGVRLQADGRVSVTRVVMRPKDKAVWIDTARKAAQSTPDMATALLLFGMPGQPTVQLNGQPLKRLSQVKIAGERAYVIPLGATVPKDLAERYAKYRDIPTASGQSQFHDWYLAGPFPRDFSAVHPPEAGVDLAATYPGIDGAPVRWSRILPPGAPALGAGPVDLEQCFSPAKHMLAYAYARVAVDEACPVTLFTGSDQEIAVWVNGKLVMERKDYYRVFTLDQDRTPLTLHKGENTILVKLAHDWEGWKFNFRLADAEGVAAPAGVRYLPAEGK
jgi:hypothetical protein